MTSDDIYVDPSALARLYIHHEGSREMAAWRTRFPGSLAVTHHGRAEIVNAICRAAFVGQLSVEGLSEALSDLSTDFASGHLRQADILWRAALNRAAELSERHTPRLGTRSLDVLHVASALELKLGHFLTFDARQQQLAKSVGLKLARVSL
jgi:predicted nucleic acid-binding protein